MPLQMSRFSPKNLLIHAVERVTRKFSGHDERVQDFFRKTPDTFDGIPLQSNVKEEMYEGCIASSVLSIDAVVKLFTEQQML
ncbi:hypothetical protein PsorP6_007778 [Peronosclerospora sorghi]|uniref:Uncharacterized protein n=1 Tax=Peronosclerospora sorghi TaxID=230839 RepID=A0ACC0WD72_9STRA|nr:hypothetical protein PsorP6_007778 [Peronosclerospora sorghi]